MFALVFQSVTSVVFGAALCGACCVPDQYFSAVRLVQTTVAPSMPDTRELLLYNAYDGKHQRVAVGYYQHYWHGLYTRNILDFAKGVEYLIQGDYVSPDSTKCIKSVLTAPWRPACAPTNSTESAAFYLGHSQEQYEPEFTALDFTYQQGALHAQAMVTRDKCAMVSEVMYDTSSSAGVRVINRIYTNQTLYNNDDYFQLPDNVSCVTQPNPPAVSPWQRMAMFGWLVSLPSQ